MILVCGGALALVAPAGKGAGQPEAELDVRVITDQAEAALVALGRAARGEPIPEHDWERLFATEGFRRLEARERSLERTIDREAFRT